MTIGVHEYVLENPLEEATDTLLAQGVLQYISSQATS